MSLNPRQRFGFTLIEFIIVFAVDALLVLFLMSAVQSARDAARRIETVNNLKQIGLGLHVYHDAVNAFPSESASSMEGQANGNKPMSVYTSLLPYVNQANMMGNSSPGPLKIYLCTNRHSFASVSTPLTDFGYQATVKTGNTPIDAILDSPFNLGLGIITNTNGSSNTLLLSIVSEKPSDYSNQSLPMQWPAPNHGTKGAAFTKDSELVTTGVGIGGPYPAIPSLYVDGHAVNIATPSSTIYPMLWSYMNQTPFTAP